MVCLGRERWTSLLLLCTLSQAAVLVPSHPANPFPSSTSAPEPKTQRYHGRYELFHVEKARATGNSPSMIRILHVSHSEIFHLAAEAGQDDIFKRLPGNSHVVVEGRLSVEPNAAVLGHYPSLLVRSISVDERFNDTSTEEQHQDHKRADNTERVVARKIQEKSIGVFVLNFNDASVPCATNELIDLMWQNNRAARQLFAIESFNNVAFVSDIEGDDAFDMYGPYNVPMSATKDKGVCDPFAWSVAAQNIARSQGVKLHNYGYHLFVLPNSVEKLCGWQGLGVVGPGCTGPCLAWVDTCSRPEVFMHELGHNMGMSHSGTNFNEAGPTYEYGDSTAIMGNSVWTESFTTIYNVVHRDQVGWYNGIYQIYRLTAGPTMNGIYRVAPLNTVNPLYRLGISIHIAESDTFYYVSYITVSNPQRLQTLIHS